MRIKLRYFASIRELVGAAKGEIELPEGSNVDGMLETVKRYYGRLRDMDRILVAVNGEYVDPGTHLVNGDVVALFPPVSGG
jgi:molybdopterin synthase sulfur carrier subunit